MFSYDIIKDFININRAGFAMRMEFQATISPQQNKR